MSVTIKKHVSGLAGPASALNKTRFVAEGGVEAVLDVLRRVPLARSNVASATAVLQNSAFDHGPFSSWAVERWVGF